MKKLQGEHSYIELKRQARFKALSTNRGALRSQINRIRDTIRQLSMKTRLAERIPTLFREQGITIMSILTAIGMAIRTLVLALTGGVAGDTPSPAPKPSNKGGVKEWIKKHLQALGHALANLAVRVAAALPSIIGSIVSGSWASLIRPRLGSLTTCGPWSSAWGASPRGRKGLASQTPTKAPLGQPGPLRLWELFFLLHGLSDQTCVVSGPEGQHDPQGQQQRLRVCHLVAPCDQSWLVLQFFLWRTFRLSRLSAPTRWFPGCGQWLLQIQRSWFRCCSPGHCPGGEPCHSGRGRALSRRSNRVVWRHTGASFDIARCCWGCRRGRQWRLRYSPCHHRHSYTKNEIFVQEGPLAAPQEYT